MAYPWHSSHHLIDVHLAVMVVLSEGRIVKEGFHVLNGVGARVRREGTRLPDWVYVPHVSYRGAHVLILVSDFVVDLFIGGV